MPRPIDNCAVCVAGGKNLNPHHFLSDREPDATYAGLTVHKGCVRDAETAVKFWNEDKPKFEGGAWRWKSNNTVVPKDMTNLWVTLGFITAEEAEASHPIREAESAAAIKRYCDYRDKHGYSAEERAEMIAAFGEGATVVNVFNGKEIKL